eukprot:7380235-Prymnesium_polylepis.1
MTRASPCLLFACVRVWECKGPAALLPTNTWITVPYSASLLRWLHCMRAPQPGSLPVAGVQPSATVEDKLQQTSYSRQATADELQLRCHGRAATRSN